MRVVVVLLCVGLCAAGCENSRCGEPLPEPDAAPPADSGPPTALEVQIGTPDEESGLEFIPLMNGGDIRLETFGQGGTHATVAVRCLGLGTNRAFVDVTVENLGTGATVMTVPSSRPQLWLCDEARLVCDQLPVHVMTGGLTPTLEERDGLAVRVIAEVRDETGRSAVGSEEGVLRKAF
jgi:hypothetical protein